MANLRRPPQLTPENAGAFRLAGVIDAYHLRTPYPRGLGPCLRGLTARPTGRILELGCGTGEIARMLAPYSERVDAIDISEGMLARAQALPGGSDPRVRWILGRVEEVALDRPYVLAVAGDSLHWMTWGTVLPRVSEALAPGASLAIVTAVAGRQPWWSALQDMIRRYSVMQDFEPYDLVEELGNRRLFKVLGTKTVGPEPFTRSVSEYIEALHATAGLAQERMGAADAQAFDQEVRRLVEPFASAGVLELSGSAKVEWGRPSPELMIKTSH